MPRRFAFWMLALSLAACLAGCGKTEEHMFTDDDRADGDADAEEIVEEELDEADNPEMESEEETTPAPEWMDSGAPGVEIMAHEITVRRFGECVAGGACAQVAFGTRDDNRLCTFADALKPNHPITCLSWAAAEAICGFSGGRLCEAEEWRAACRGPADVGFPYGNVYDSDACNGLDAGEGVAAATGSFADCVGGQAGLADMSGNVAEWLAGCEEESGTLKCPLAGGSWESDAAGLKCDSIVFAVPDRWRAPMGTRCCRDLTH